MFDMDITGNFFPAENKKQSKGNHYVNILETNVRLMFAQVSFAVE